MESNTNPFTHNIMDKSDTPELDALRDECEDAKHTHAECEHLLWRLCRKLERERNEARQATRQWIEAWDRYGDGASLMHPRLTMAITTARKSLPDNADVQPPMRKESQ